MKQRGKTAVRSLAAILALALACVANRATAQLSVTAHPPSNGVEKTVRYGGKSGEKFEEAPRGGAILTGLVICLSENGGRSSISGLQGIYLGPGGRSLGLRRGVEDTRSVVVEAKAGYAVSGVGLEADGGILGLQVFFMRLNPGVADLNPADFYVSDWLGAPSEAVTYLGNDGRLVMGYAGLQNPQLAALALVQAAPASLDPPSPQIIATDEAANYQDHWESAGNKGSGFGPWIFQCTDAQRQKAAFGLGDSTTNGADVPSGGINSAGKSWEMHAAPGEEASVVRAFSHGPLQPGQQFYLELDTGEIEKGGIVGFALQNSAGADRFEYVHAAGRRFTSCRCNGAELITPIPFHKSGFRMIFTQLANSHLLFDLRAGGGDFTLFPGVIAASDISQVKLYARGAGGLPKNFVYWNRMRIQQPR